MRFRSRKISICRALVSMLSGLPSLSRAMCRSTLARSSAIILRRDGRRRHGRFLAAQGRLQQAQHLHDCPPTSSRPAPSAPSRPRRCPARSPTRACWPSRRASTPPAASCWTPHAADEAGAVAGPYYEECCELLWRRTGAAPSNTTSARRKWTFDDEMTHLAPRYSFHTFY